MAAGDPTLENLGMYTVSGQALKDAVDAVTLYNPLLSGSRLHFIYCGEGQLNLLVERIEQ